MRAVVIDEVGVLPTVREVPEPACPPGGVVLDVSATGVCRSDWHAWQGHEPVPLPHVPGHELAGTIRQVGEGVTRWSVGDRVTTPFVCGCGACPTCAAGESQVCPQQTQPGFTGWGSWAEQVALHAADHNLVALPDSLGDVHAAALGCRFATSYRALVTHGGVGPGQWVAVHGAGGAGLSAVLIARALGARVVAVDMAPTALERARALGAEGTLDARGLSPEQVGEAVHDLTDGGAHVSLDAFGSPAAALASVLGLRRRGRHVQVGLLLGEAARTALPMDRVVAWELAIHGTHGLAARDYPAMLELVTGSGGRPGIALEGLVGREVGLEDAPAALAELGAAAGGGITVIRP